MFSLGNKILSHRLVHFVNDLIPTDLFPYLSCLSQEDKEKVLCVETNDGPSRATYTLVDRLQKKSNNCDKAFREFVRALRKTGSDHVAILLDPQYAVSLDDESERSDGESFHFRVMAGTAIDVKIAANFYDDSKRRLTDLEKAIIAQFQTSSSDECRRVRRKFVEYLPQGATFVHTKTEGSAMLVFRLSKVSAIDKLWEMYNDDSFRELLEKLLFSDETGKTTKEQTIEVDLTFVTDVYNKVREELEGGMTQNEQERVISRFRSGEINIIVATTVAEEGLDIKDCSYVIRYGMKGNEISTVQARGRVRAKDGQFSVVVSAKARSAKREELNEFREMLMLEAIADVQKMDRKDYQEEICALQKMAAREREVKQKVTSARRSLFHLDGITFYCLKCQEEACQARDIRVLKDSFYVVVTSDFKKKVKTKPLRKPKTFDGLTFNEKVHCGKCNEDWGTTVKIDGLPEVYCIKVCAFALQMTKGSKNRCMFKKWNKVPFDVPNADVEDLLNNED